MDEIANQPGGSEPPAVTYKNPRRTSPENSVTLQNHGIPSEEASKLGEYVGSLNRHTRRRRGSNESYNTATSDPKQWFDRSNAQCDATYDISKDVDPPCDQQETDSSNEGAGTQYALLLPRSTLLQPTMRPSLAQSSVDDYRSVIDDLTVENQKLKEELRRYKQMGPEALRGDKLFEVKIHGLPPAKKRELEATLRQFTTSLDGSSKSFSSQPNKKTKGQANQSSQSKHASSSSGSQNRPTIADSAYASMPAGPSSSGTPFTGRGLRSRSDYFDGSLTDIPDGLWPRHSNIMSEKEKKKLVVRRLEQIFTGRGLRTPGQAHIPLSSSHANNAASAGPMGFTGAMGTTSDTKVTKSTDAIREAQILPRFPQRNSHDRSRNDEESMSISNTDQTEMKDTSQDGNNGNDGTGGNGGAGDNSRTSGNGQNDQTAPENHSKQRPTRPVDLDPDRVQVPSENMEYIRHLGLADPAVRSHYSAVDVAPDAEGWVYLNLLCNLAQLHILNVTSAFVRAAVSEKSTQFQLSPDGHKIRWRGGDEGTRFLSDSIGSNSQRGNSSEDTDESNDQKRRKKNRTQTFGNEVIVSELSKFGPQISGSSSSFHYKPIFAHHRSSSSDEQPSNGCETGSSCGPPEDSNLGMNLRWNTSGTSGGFQRKRRRDGAIIYYTGAPFCTDLSGDVSADCETRVANPSVYPTGALIGMKSPEFGWSESGSSIPFKPLSHYPSHRAMLDLDFVHHDSLSSSEDTSEIEAHFPWSDQTQSIRLANLEASGLGGITPEDHFVVTVSTHRPVSHAAGAGRRRSMDEPCHYGTPGSSTATESLAGRIAIVSTRSPGPSNAKSSKDRRMNIKYVSRNVMHLPPVPLPPPTHFFMLSSDSSMDTDSDSDSDSDSESSSSEYGGASHQLRRPLLDRLGPSFSRTKNLSSLSEGVNSNDETELQQGKTQPPTLEETTSGTVDKMLQHWRGRELTRSRLTTGSSVATAGGVASGYSSAAEL